MGIFNFSKKSASAELRLPGPYKDTSTNLIYHLIFCDNIELYQINVKKPYQYPFDILFSENSRISDLQKVIDDESSEPRVQLLAYNLQMKAGYKPPKKELLGVVAEVALDGGLDVLASFKNGTARYINQTGKILIWENTEDAAANRLTKDLFEKSEKIIAQIGPWDKPRRPFPPKGLLRLSFLVSDGLYFGEGGIDNLFNDEMAGPALAVATELMKYLTEKVVTEKI